MRSFSSVGQGREKVVLLQRWHDNRPLGFLLQGTDRKDQAHRRSIRGRIPGRVRNQVEKGLDVKDMMLSLSDILRDLMLIKNGVGGQLVEPSFTLEK